MQRTNKNELKQEATNKEFLSTKEVSELLNISKVTCWQWGKKGILKPLRIGNRVLYRRSDIIASIKPIYGEEGSND